MKFSDVFVDSLGVYLGQQHPIDDFVGQGLLTTAERDRWGWAGVSIAGEIAPTAMAVAAGERALGASSISASDIDLLIHTGSMPQGQLGWPITSYLQRELAPLSGMAFEIRQGCSGGVVALQTAASMLQADPSLSAAMVTGADTHYWYDRFEWVREHEKRQRVVPLHGDGAGAVVLRRDSGFAQLVAANSASVPELEEFYRRRGPQFPVPLAVPTVPEWIALLDESAQRDSWLRQLSIRSFRTISRTIQATVDEAAVDPSDAILLAPFSLSRPQLDSMSRITGIGYDDDLFDYGKSVGHLTVSDHVAGLHRLLGSGRDVPTYVVVVAIGWSVAMSCLVLRLG